MTRFDFTNGRRIWGEIVDDSDPEVIWVRNIRGRRVLLFRRLIKAIV